MSSFVAINFQQPDETYVALAVKKDDPFSDLCPSGFPQFQVGIIVFQHVRCGLVVGRCGVQSYLCGFNSSIWQC